MFTVFDQWSRESVLIEPGFRKPGQLVTEASTRVSVTRLLPQSIRVDHATEFTSKALYEWAWKIGVQIIYIRPEKHAEDGMIKSSNRRLCDERLNCNEFESLQDVRTGIEA